MNIRGPFPRELWIWKCANKYAHSTGTLRKPIRERLRKVTGQKLIANTKNHNNVPRKGVGKFKAFPKSFVHVRENGVSFKSVINFAKPLSEQWVPRSLALFMTYSQ